MLLRVEKGVSELSFHMLLIPGPFYFFKALLTIFAESPYKIKYRAFSSTNLLFFQHRYILGLCF